MPYKTEKIQFPSKMMWKSAKLLPCQKEMMHWWHDRGMAIRAITRMFGCDRRVVQYELFPERYQRELERKKKAYKDQKINEKRRAHREGIRKKHRRRKHTLLKHIA